MSKGRNPRRRSRGEALQRNAVVRLLSERGYALHHVESDQMIEPSNSELAIRGHIYAS